MLEKTSIALYLEKTQCQGVYNGTEDFVPTIRRWQNE